MFGSDMQRSIFEFLGLFVSRLPLTNQDSHKVKVSISTSSPNLCKNRSEHFKTYIGTPSLLYHPSQGWMAIFLTSSSYLLKHRYLPRTSPACSQQKRDRCKQHSAEGSTVCDLARKYLHRSATASPSSRNFPSCMLNVRVCMKGHLSARAQPETRAEVRSIQRGR